MAISNKYRALVLSTGNKSELATGYCTQYGDMVGGLAVIADIYKMMVYDLARWINRDGDVIPKACLEKPFVRIKPMRAPCRPASSWTRSFRTTLKKTQICKVLLQNGTSRWISSKM
jgi:hypothetical protein